MKLTCFEWNVVRASTVGIKVNYRGSYLFVKIYYKDRVYLVDKPFSRFQAYNIYDVCMEPLSFDNLGNEETPSFKVFMDISKGAPEYKTVRVRNMDVYLYSDMMLRYNVLI